MKTEDKEKRIAKYAEEFEAYSERAQGMQMMLAMCIKAGLPMPKLEDLEEYAKNKKGA